MGNPAVTSPSGLYLSRPRSPKLFTSRPHFPRVMLNAPWLASPPAAIGQLHRVGGVELFGWSHRARVEVDRGGFSTLDGHGNNYSPITVILRSDGIQSSRQSDEGWVLVGVRDRVSLPAEDLAIGRVDSVRSMRIVVDELVRMAGFRSRVDPEKARACEVQAAETDTGGRRANGFEDEM